MGGQRGSDGSGEATRADDDDDAGTRRARGA